MYHVPSATILAVGTRFLSTTEQYFSTKFFVVESNRIHFTQCTQLPSDPTKYTAKPSFHAYCVLVVMLMVGRGLPMIFGAWDRRNTCVCSENNGNFRFMKKIFIYSSTLMLSPPK